MPVIGVLALQGDVREHMRALGDPDAFPATDRGVLGAAAALGLPHTPLALTARVAAWRPCPLPGRGLGEPWCARIR